MAEHEHENKIEKLADDNTAEELHEKAQELDIEGRSSMNKDELAKAVAEAEKDSDAKGAGTEDASKGGAAKKGTQSGTQEPPTPESQKQGGDETLPGEALDVDPTERTGGTQQQPSTLSPSIGQPQGKPKDSGSEE